MRLLEQFRKHFPGSMDEHLDVVRRVARGWMLLGSLIVLFIGAMAVSHYWYGAPIHDRNTGQLSTPENTRAVFLLIGGGGAFFAVIGLILHKVVGLKDRSHLWIGLTVAGILGFLGIALLHSLMPLD